MLVPKLFTCLKDYSKEQFIRDVIAGIIVAIIALPLSIALAIASGVSPEKGMYTAIVGGFIISLLGGSRVQIGGPTGAFVIIVYGIIEKYGIEGLTIATIIAGVFLIIMGLFRFGAMIKYIPYPITTGFTSGIAVTIFSTQIKDFFGMTIDKVPSEFICKWMTYFKSINSINLTALFIGALSLLIIIFWPKINKKVPGTLIAVIVSTVIVMAFGMNVETIGSRFGDIPSGFSIPVIPKVNINMVRELIMPGITIAILGGVESLLSAVVADGMIGGNHRSNMELVAQGVANIFSGVLGGIPATGAIARTAANIKNGGRTPIAGIVHAVSLLVIMLALMPLVKLIPMASLAAILIVVSYNMGEWEAFKQMNRAPKSDVLVFLTTFALTIFLDLVVAIGVGVVLSSFLFMRRMAEVTDVTYELDVRENDECARILEDNAALEQISFYEISGPFFFGAADKFVNTIREIGVPSKVLIIKMGSVPAMDSTAFHAMEMLYDICNKNKTKLIISELQEQPMQMLEKYGFIEKLGHENFCPNIKESVRRADELLV
ncbi:SulP family inorganic anion transporter [Clostridium sp. ZS2-4]|uniref:SulP family inorganic anion transporter n=1 Tax=Clostridium sp. ZS2-4 TaxID=2987703 RepID=UPI00227AA5B9|nr:sulfate permease [Clostridium sp. ZS2-4]MCY6355509.1 sulfate permease [Clostridium sp. ZS2-4]